MPAADSLSAAALFAAAWLFSLGLAILELGHLVPDLNDGILHLRLVDHVTEALAAGDNPTDSWLATFGMGFPLFHHYQHLPHVLLGFLSWLLGDAVSSLVLLRGSELLLVLLFPLSVAWTTWRLADDVAGCFAGLGAVLLSTAGLYGLELTSYGWAGQGLATQLWASVLIGPAWLTIRDAVNGRRGLALPALLVAILIVTHTLIAYLTALTAVLFCIAPRGGAPLARLGHRLRRSGVAGLLPLVASLGRRWFRLGALLGLAALIASYFVIPFLLDRHAMNRSVWEKASKYDGYGLIWTLEALLGGELFDGGHGFRLPLLTMLLVTGLLIFWLQRPWRLPFARARREFVLLFGVWSLLFCGRPLWGSLLDLLPFSGDLHLHRLIVPVQLAGLVLIGLTAGPLWRAAFVRFPSRRGRLLLVGLSLVLLLQPVAEQVGKHRLRRLWVEQTRAALEHDDGALAQLVAQLDSGRSVRAYAGRAPNWGGGYKVGDLPVYSRLSAQGIDSLGYLYHALSLNSDIQVYFDEMRLAHYRLFNIGWVLAPATKQWPEFVTPVARRGDHLLSRVISGGYFDLVQPAGTYAGTRAEWFVAARRWLASPAVEARRHPVFYVGRSAPAGARPLSQMSIVTQPVDGLGVLSGDTFSPGRLTVNARIDQPCVLMAKTTFHPNWRVMVDGQPREPIMVAPAFVGVALAPGAHRVELEYRPRPLRFWLLVIGLASGLAVGWWERHRRRARAL